MGWSGRALPLLEALGEDPIAIRAQVVRALRTAELADGAGACNFARAGDWYELAWSDAEGVGERVYERAADPRFRRHVLRHGDLRLASPLERRSFRTLEQLVDRAVLLESPTWTELYGPTRVRDPMRLVVAHEGRIVAHVAV